MVAVNTLVMSSRSSLLLRSVLYSSLLSLIPACGNDSSDRPSCEGDTCDEISSVVELEQGRGWGQFKERFRFTHQGSRMIPYSWLINLEQASSDERFVSPTNMDRLGFTLDLAPTAESRSLNPDNLPIGLVKDPRVGRYGEEWAGLTCSACHTGQITYKGTAFQIDGGSGLLDLQGTERELLAAVEATQAAPEKWARFTDNVLGASASPDARAELENNVIDFVADLRRRGERSAPAIPGALIGQGGTLDLPYGPGRVDAFTILVNESICKMLPLAENCRPGNTPTTYPHLWGITDLDWVQTNSLTHAVLGRNLGEVLGVYAHSSMENCGPEHPQVCDFTSTADLDNLVALESWVKHLDAPKWHEDFPAIDPDLAADGAELYARDCQSCHALPNQGGSYETSDPNPDSPNGCGRVFVETQSTPICFDYNGVDLLGGLAAANCDAEVTIGTDPFLAANFLARRGKTGMLAPLFGGQEEVSAAELLGTIQTLIIQQAFESLGYSQDDILHALDYRDSATPSLANLTGYKARPLDGIAFTAPFLHNGSIPTIAELLKRPSERLTEFWVGRREFDPVNLGFIATAPEGDEELFRYDSSLPGNHNSGHEFGPAAAEYEGDDNPECVGASLDSNRACHGSDGRFIAGECCARESDRMALLEYLKTLDVTPRSQEPLSSCSPN